jgi:ACR3 family arsenite efflux pump ArsB
MALIAWVFMHFLFASFIPTPLQNEYIMGMIILGLAPCTAMTLVWTYLARANLSCALIQVSINDLIILALFAPTGMLLLGLTTGFPVPRHSVPLHPLVRRTSFMQCLNNEKNCSNYERRKMVRKELHSKS